LQRQSDRQPSPPLRHDKITAPQHARSGRRQQSVPGARSASRQATSTRPRQGPPPCCKPTAKLPVTSNGLAPPPRWRMPPGSTSCHLEKSPWPLRCGIA